MQQQDEAESLRLVSPLARRGLAHNAGLQHRADNVIRTNVHQQGPQPFAAPSDERQQQQARQPREIRAAAIPARAAAPQPQPHPAPERRPMKLTWPPSTDFSAAPYGDKDFFHKWGVPTRKHPAKKIVLCRHPAALGYLGVRCLGEFHAAAPAFKDILDLRDEPTTPEEAKPAHHLLHWLDDDATCMGERAEAALHGRNDALLRLINYAADRPLGAFLRDTTCCATPNGQRPDAALLSPHKVTMVVVEEKVDGGIKLAEGDLSRKVVFPAEVPIGHGIVAIACDRTSLCMGVLRRAEETAAVNALLENDPQLQRVLAGEPWIVNSAMWGPGSGTHTYQLTTMRGKLEAVRAALRVGAWIRQYEHLYSRAEAVGRLNLLNDLALEGWADVELLGQQKMAYKYRSKLAGAAEPANSLTSSFLRLTGLACLTGGQLNGPRGQVNGPHGELDGPARSASSVDLSDDVTLVYDDREGGGWGGGVGGGRGGGNRRQQSVGGRGSNQGRGAAARGVGMELGGAGVVEGDSQPHSDRGLRAEEERGLMGLMGVVRRWGYEGVMQPSWTWAVRLLCQTVLLALLAVLVVRTHVLT